MNYIYSTLGILTFVFILFVVQLDNSLVDINKKVKNYPATEKFAEIDPPYGPEAVILRKERKQFISNHPVLSKEKDEVMTAFYNHTKIIGITCICLGALSLVLRLRKSNNVSTPIQENQMLVTSK